MHHFPGQRYTSQRHSFGSISSGVFPHDRHSPGRDTTSQACRFSCFFCAAYGLLLPQTRTQCSNSASRAIAMLEKSAKISPNACEMVSLSGKWRSCGKLLCFRKRYRFEVYFNARFFCLVQLSAKGAADKVEQPICTDESHSTIKVQISPLVRADLWQIFVRTTNHKSLIYWRRMIASYARRRNEA